MWCCGLQGWKKLCEAGGERKAVGKERKWQKMLKEDERRARQRAGEQSSDWTEDLFRHLWKGGNLRIGTKMSPKSRCFADEYKLSAKALGSGMNGTVVLARPQKSMMLAEAVGNVTSSNASGSVAVKTLEKAGLTNAQLDWLLLEADVNLQLDHANIAKLLRVYNERERVFLVMEHCSGGTLSERLKSARSFSEEEAALVIIQVLRAVNYCHSRPERKVCHRDLKPDNFVYANKDKEAPLKMIDFGLSRTVSNSHPTLNKACGTLNYVAPEVLRRQRYDIKCDIWSVGVMAYELICGKTPFEGETDKITIAAILKAELDSLDSVRFEGISDAAKEFLRSLLQSDPAKRPTAEQALQHRWLAHLCLESRVPVNREVLEQLSSFASENAVWRAAAAVLVYSSQVGSPTSEANGQHLLKQFRALDTDGDGIISKAELVRAFEETLGMSRQGAERTFDQLDLNGDVEIHHSEFLAATLGASVLSRRDFDANDNLISELFARFDRDQNGQIDLAELTCYLGERFCGMPTAKIFEELDRDGSGGIDLKEFTAKLSDKADVAPKSVSSKCEAQLPTVLPRPGGYRKESNAMLPEKAEVRPKSGSSSQRSEALGKLSSKVADATWGQ